MNTDTFRLLQRRLLSQRMRNAAASMLLLYAFGLVYAWIPYCQDYFSASTVWRGASIRHWDVLLAVAMGYSLILLAYYLFEKSPRESKSVAALRAMRRFATRPQSALRSPLPYDERLGLLSVALKGFFAPLMVVWLFDHSVTLVEQGDSLRAQWLDGTISWRSLASAEGYWFVFRLIVFADVLFFTLGYLIELPILGNTIRSVDPTLFGWAVALACYPPFNGITSSVFGWHSSEFPQFIDYPLVHIIANLAILALMAVYSWSSLALNFKASNLTHRGIVARGPYRWVRHPAYVSKNLAWWIGLGPALLASSQTGWLDGLLVAGSMFGWSLIYYLRATTEEDHLRSVDDSYDQYCRQVKYRFIPGVV